MLRLLTLMVLAYDTTNETYCIGRGGADPKMLLAALDWAGGLRKGRNNATNQTMWLHMQHTLLIRIITGWGWL
ncbi:hypothetical protein HHK36_032403 [Tetracentron sinense]|uniref:Uncharacterized protein n=1 Tax=Tetracentron sinense TaxID=13715 RepID=A0A834Y7D2_TETSI|nr:hypothetical protein HHK36_032403 [Tetracentron sinense]